MTSRFGQQLLRWYIAEGRFHLPWNQTKDPYLIWLSEVILQQTRVEQGLPYYERFVARFPDVYKLAEAHIDDVLKLWEGLGYYSRARNLHKGAQYVVSHCQGKLPPHYTQLLKIPGVGPYTASAIASLAFGRPHAVVDGNVYRILSRYFDVREPIDTTTTKKDIARKAQGLLDDHPPADFNRAMMDLGSMVCKPRNPLCSNCPVASGCLARENGVQQDLPIKTKKKPRKKRHYKLVARLKEGELDVVRRTADDIWKGLYFLPELDKVHGKVQKVGSVKHLLTHLELSLDLYIPKQESLVQIKKAVEKPLKNKAFPVPVIKLLQEIQE